MTRLTLTELLAGLAEECCELGQAALKLRRAYDGTNPTPVTIDQGWERFEEEIADVELYLSKIKYNRNYVRMIKEKKAERWEARLNAGSQRREDPR